MGKSVGFSDEMYDLIEKKANEVGIAKMALVEAMCRYALPRLKVRTQIAFDDVPISVTDELKQAVDSLQELPESPNGTPVEDAHPTIRDMVRVILRTAGKPLNLYDIREGMRKRYPGVDINSTSLSSNLRGANDLRQLTDTVPYRYALIIKS